MAGPPDKHQQSSLEEEELKPIGESASVEDVARGPAPGARKGGRPSGRQEFDKAHRAEADLRFQGDLRREFDRKPDAAQDSTARGASLPRHSPQANYDEELDRLVHEAANAGLERGADNAINYTTLLIGFAICDDAASRFLQSHPAFKRAELLASRPIGTDAVGTRTGGELAQTPLPLRAGASIYSPSAREMLDLASDVCREVTGSTGVAVGTQHLLGAYLLRNPGFHDVDLRQWGLDGDDLAAAFVQFAAESWPDEAGGWRKLHLSMADEQRAEVDKRAKLETRYVASFGADDPAAQKRDLLDVRDEARAFARIAASNKTRLPLSIGVFGEWGSGKTFFMELMADHVAQLSERARADADGSLFLPDIVQIKFNAWHYIETNLWASLVDYIFSELDRSLQHNRKPSAQVEQLFEQLSTSRLLKLEAVKNLIVKRRERRAAEQRLDGAHCDYEAALLRQSGASSVDFWRAVLKTFMNKVEKEGAADRVKTLARKLGLNDLSESAASLNEVLKEAESEVGRARVLHRAMAAKLGQGTWITAVVITLVAVPACLVLAKEWLGALLESDWIAKVNDGVLALSGAVATASALVGRAVQSARATLTELEGFRARLDEAVKERTDEFKQSSDEGGKFAATERELARLKNELEQAERKFADADKRSDEVLREYHSVTPRGRLNAFIRDKLASGDYAKHLGLIATIRKDFEQLAQLMADAQDDGASRKAYLDAHEEHRQRLRGLLEDAKREGTLSEEEFAELGKESAAPEPGLFTRIVLYIDDLDRCPTDKVVDVLQAIHLLLFFPLFVVVVAVDARWVSRSLREQYPQLLAENIIAPRRARGKEALRRQTAQSDHEAIAPAAATSHDYLEKIFQIPYWVRAMDRDASMKYVKGIADKDLREGVAVARVPPATGISASLRGAPRPEQGAAEVKQPGAGVSVRAPVPAAQQQNAGARSAGAPDRPAEEESREDAAYVASSMNLETAERDFLEALAPYVGGTPRRGLRFVNIYRLVKTSLPPSLQDQLADAGGKGLGYRALITQLAIVSGAPHLSSTYFQFLEGAAGAIARRTALPEVAGREAVLGVATLDDLCQWLRRHLAPHDGSQKLALLGALEKLGALNAEQGLDVGTPLLLALDRFAPIARRYSFTARPH